VEANIIGFFKDSQSKIVEKNEYINGKLNFSAKNITVL
jgi:hypothetical protein